MSLGILHDIVNTGSVVRLSAKFAKYNEYKWPNREFWHGTFWANVIPLPCEGDQVKEYRVELHQHPIQESKRGFAVRLRPDNTLVTPEPDLEGVPIIGEKLY